MAESNNFLNPEYHPPNNDYDCAAYHQQLGEVDSLTSRLSRVNVNAFPAPSNSHPQRFKSASGTNSSTGTKPISIATNLNSSTEHVFTQLKFSTDPVGSSSDYPGGMATGSFSHPASPNSYHENAQSRHESVDESDSIESASSSYASTKTILPSARGKSDTSTDLEPSDVKVVHKNIKGTKGTAEPLNPRFKLHHSKHFKVGHVFKMLWVEPLGEPRSAGATEVTDYTIVTDGKYVGQRNYESIRRFVVVADHDGHCLCLPILTYKRKGVTKGGAKSNDHTIIYSSAVPNTPPPAAIVGESFKKDPIRMVPKDPRHKLDIMSRLNYAKIYTVEHNVKVLFIGEIAPESKRTLMMDFEITSQSKR